MNKYVSFCQAPIILLSSMVLVAKADTTNQPVKESPPSPPPPATETQSVESAKPATVPTDPAKAKVNQEGIPVAWQVAEIVKMSAAGVEPPVLKAYVESCQYATAPSAYEIIYLRDHGIPSDIMVDYMRRGQQLQEQAAAAANQQNQTPEAPPPAPVPANPAPVPDYAPPKAAETDNYAYPTYGYADNPPYVFAPPIYGGFSGAYYLSRPIRFAPYPGRHLGAAHQGFHSGFHGGHGGRGR